MQRYLKDYLRNEAISKMVVSLDELLGQLEVVNGDNGSQLQPLGNLSEARFLLPYSGFYWQIQDSQEVLKRSRSLWDTQIKFRHLNRRFGLRDFMIKGPDGQFLFVLQQKVKLPDSERFYWVSIAQDVAPLYKALAGVRRSLFFGLGLLTLAVLGLITLQLTWGLRPLATLRKEIGEIESGKQTRFKHDYPLEINPLVQDINQLLDHHQQSLEQARTNAGNMAHALKTPLSIMQNELAQPSDESNNVLQSQLLLMRQQIEYHLSRSQIAAKQLLGLKCSPYEQCHQAVSAFSRLYQDKQIQVQIDIDADLAVAVDSRDFDEMLGNLIENAFKWALQSIVISAHIEHEAQDKRLAICVADDGQGMTESQCQWVMQRGLRLDEQTAGHGLGLNIVVQMVNLYQGEIRLTRSAIGGLAATVFLPLRS